MMMEPPPPGRLRRRPSLEPMPPPASPNRHPFCRTASLAPARSELQLLEQLLQAASPTNTIPGAHLQPISPSATFHQRRHSAHANSTPPPVPERKRQGPPPPLNLGSSSFVHLLGGSQTSLGHLESLNQLSGPFPVINRHPSISSSYQNNNYVNQNAKIPAPPPPLPPRPARGIVEPPSVPPLPQLQQPSQQQQQQPLQQQQQQQQQQQEIQPTNDSQSSNKAINQRQESNISSDSFSQASSSPPSYTPKSLETPLLPPPRKYSGTGILSRQSRRSAEPPPQLSNISAVAHVGSMPAPPGSPLTKSVSTPASLQAIVRFHSGSNMSLHYRIIRDIRRPSAHYINRGQLRFRFVQVIVNAVVLLAIAVSLVAYFKANPVRDTKALASRTSNPAPGICLPVIVNFCQYHQIPYNYTIFPNYMGHFTQREAKGDLEVYEAVVEVRCYELTALFLCSLFVPKCGSNGQMLRPCRSLCAETMRRCGFFLQVFALTLPDYLECSVFPEKKDDCVGYHEVIEAQQRAKKPPCLSGFQCDRVRCIPADWRCDGHVDCQDQSDELECPQCGKGEIHCGENKCMTQSHVCDGVLDCPWGQDERNCLRLSERMGDIGKGQLEVFHPEEKSWKLACPSSWNPRTSPDYVCQLLGYKTANFSTVSAPPTSSVLGSNSPQLFKASKVVRMSHHGSSTTPWNFIRDLKTCKANTPIKVNLTCTSFVCGIRRHPEKASKRIIGGATSSPGDWPFLAALLGGPEEIFYCAGVLIADQWVLTASHCVGNFSQTDQPTGWTIQLGITRRHSHAYFGQKVKVRRVVAHPQYNQGVQHDNDVALFQLQSRVTFHEHLLPVCLPSPEKELRAETICTVIGWGKREDNAMYEPAVNEVEVPVLDRKLCNTWLQHKDLNVTDGMICAGYAEGGKDACQGDSGGPLLCRDESDRWFVGGIVSWGIKCAHPRLPGVYAYVPKYVPWITQQMENYSE